MDYILICNIASDTISKINIEDNTVEHLPLDLGEKPVGPHGIETYKDKIITANNYSNSISIINMNTFQEEQNIYIGAHPNDVKVLENKAYILCGEANSLIVYDLLKDRITLELPLDTYPHNLVIDKDKKIAYVSNMNGHSVTVIDCNENKVLNKIKVQEYPTKINLSKDKKKIYLCESYLGYDTNGYIAIIDVLSNKILKRIKVGVTPIDFFEDKGKLYVSNFEEGTISVIDIEKEEEVKKIFIGGMPRGIIKKDNLLIIGDYLKGKVRLLDLKENKIKNIAVGTEPNAMILIHYPH